AELVAGRGRAGHFRGAVRHRDWPFRRHSGGHRLQPIQPPRERVRGTPPALRRPRPRPDRPRAGAELMAMGLHASSRNRGRSGRRAPMAEINVTPFVDVMLVLLIIFMVTAPMLASGVPVELPESRANALDQQPDQITISIDREGFIYVDETLIERGGFPASVASMGCGVGGSGPL